VIVTVFNDEGAPPEGDVIIFREKPNPILYGIEATRMIVLPLLCLNVALVVLLYIARGAPILFLVKLNLLLDIVLFGIFILAMAPAAVSLEFVVTRKDAIVRFAPFGVGARRFSVPIEDIEGIEVRSYGPRYGSVYLGRYQAGHGSSRQQPIHVKKAPGDASAWTSLPWSWPPMAGLYGFKNYNQFADLIVSLRSEAQQPVRSEACG
jgi:hypothetical protein